MKFGTYVFPLLLLLLFTSCTEELVSVTSTPEPEQDIEVGPDANDVQVNVLSLSTQELDIRKAYLSTTHLAAENVYEHHFLLTEDPSTAESPSGSAFAFSIFSDSPTPDLNKDYSQLNDDNSLDPRGVFFPSFDISVGQNFSRPGYELIPSFQENTDGTVTIKLKKRGANSSEIAGTINLPILKLADLNSPMPELPAVNGENYISFRGERSTAGHAYLKKKNGAGGAEDYYLYITRDEVSTNGALRGVTDLFLFPIQIPANAELTGTINIDQPIGYSGSLRDKQVSGYFCRNMDFSTGFADDDEPTDGGEAILNIENGHLTAHWSFVTNQGALTTGFYEGDLVLIE